MPVALNLSDRSFVTISNACFSLLHLLANGAAVLHTPRLSSDKELSFFTCMFPSLHVNGTCQPQTLPTPQPSDIALASRMLYVTLPENFSPYIPTFAPLVIGFFVPHSALPFTPPRSEEGSS